MRTAILLLISVALLGCTSAANDEQIAELERRLDRIEEQLASGDFDVEDSSRQFQTPESPGAPLEGDLLLRFEAALIDHTYYGYLDEEFGGIELDGTDQQIDLALVADARDAANLVRPLLEELGFGAEVTEEFDAAGTTGEAESETQSLAIEWESTVDAVRMTVRAI